VEDDRARVHDAHDRLPELKLASQQTARAAVIPAPGHAAEIVELPVPALEQDSALLQVELSEVCGTDVHLRAGRLSGVPYPLIPGHVSVGRLSAIRGALTDVYGRALREGDLVTFLDVHRTCNACWHCLVAKASTRCPNRRVYGITYGAVDGLAGGWAETMYLKPDTRIIPLDSVDPETFMAGGCSLPTALHGVERADIMLGDTVLVLGSGPVGLSSIILARMRGAGIVLCIGAPAGRLHAAQAVGAGAVLDFTSGNAAERLEWVLQHTAGRGADVTIEATGAPEAVIDAMRYTRDAGRVAVLGQYTDHGEVAFNPHSQLNRKHLDVRGVWGSDYSHFHRSVELLRDAQRAAAWEPLRLERYALADANRALDLVAEGAVIKALIDPAA
jgi:threonine dehydrogenase-like Zn-dependent dehydrogenase